MLWRTIAGESSAATDNCDATATSSFGLDVATISPTGLVATATSGTTIALVWNSVNGADHYEVIRNSGSGFSPIASPVMNGHTDSVAPNTAHVYRVRAIASTGQASPYGNSDVATATIFTNEPLGAGATIIRAEHLTQIRTAVNAVRTTAGLALAIYIDTNPAGLPIKAVHITELRTALDAARSALGLSALTYTNAPLNGMPVRALDFTELRSGVK